VAHDVRQRAAALANDEASLGHGEKNRDWVGVVGKERERHATRALLQHHFFP